MGILVATDTHNLFNTQFSGFPYDIRGDDTTLRDQAFEAMVGDANNDMFEKMLPTQDERTFLGEPVQVIYESDFNCLTPSNLQSMKLLEDAAVGLDSFNNTLCQLESGVCRLPRSILRFFDGTFASRDSIFIADPTFSRISQIIGHAFDSTSSPDIRSILSYHIGTGKPSTLTPPLISVYRLRCCGSSYTILSHHVLHWAAPRRLQERRHQP